MIKQILYRRSKKLIVEQSNNLVSALDPYTGKIYELNKTGSFIWKILTKPKREKEIIEEVIKEFDVIEKKAINDVISFLNQSVREKLLTKLE